MDINRLKAIVLYVLNNVPGKCLGKHELFKILYFASQERLVEYGHAMIDDFYAFEYGPVPSQLFDYLKGKSNAILSSINVDAETSYILSPQKEPDMDELSKACVICLDKSINENYGLTFDELTNKSHDFAWNKAWTKKTDGKRGDKIDTVNIAIAAGADKGTIEYIQEDLEIRAALGC